MLIDRGSKTRSISDNENAEMGPLSERYKGKLTIIGENIRGAFGG